MSEADGLWWLLAGPAAGLALYGGLYRHYRNTDKSHAFEHETQIHAQPLKGSDVLVDHVQGTQRRRMDGDNVSAYRQRRHSSRDGTSR